jgi:hypothetical protein
MPLDNIYYRATFFILILRFSSDKEQELCDEG